MPHFIIDCSESILLLVEPVELMRSVYIAAESTDLFARSSVGGIKVRLNPYRHYINLGGQEHFVHVFAYLMKGRTQKEKQQLSEEIICNLKKQLPTIETISINIQNFENFTYQNASTTEAVESTPMATAVPVGSQKTDRNRRRSLLTHWPVSPAWVTGSRSEKSEHGSTCE